MAFKSKLLTHQMLLRSVARLGHGIYPGLCSGYSMVAAQYYLHGRINAFNTQLSQLERYHDDLPQAVEMASKRVMSMPLTPSDNSIARTTLAIPNFLREIAVAQNAPNLRSNFGRFTSQWDYSHISNHLSPWTIDENGTTTFSDSGRLELISKQALALDQKLLQQYLIEKQAVLKEYDVPSASFITNHEHAILIAFDINNQHWLLFDINQLGDDWQVPGDPQSAHPLKCNHELSSQILRSFDFNNEVSNNDVFTIASYTTPRPEHSIKNKLIHEINHLNTLFSRKNSSCKKEAQSTTSLHLSAHFGLIEQINSSLAQNAEVDKEYTSQGYTPLYLACGQGHEAIVKDLLEQKADVNKATCFNDTPLHAAAYYGHHRVIHTLLKHGANIDTKTDCGETPLAIAIIQNQIIAVHLLLKYGADVNIIDEGVSALLLAAQRGYHEIVRLLLHYGANINQEMPEGDTPLFSAALNKHYKTVNILLSHPSCNKTTIKNTLGLLRAYALNNPCIQTLEYALSKIDRSSHAFFNTKKDLSSRQEALTAYEQNSSRCEF